MTLTQHTKQYTHDMQGDCPKVCEHCGFSLRDTAAEVPAPPVDQPIGLHETVLHPYLSEVIGEVVEIFPDGDNSLAQVKWLHASGNIVPSLMYYRDLRRA